MRYYIEKRVKDINSHLQTSSVICKKLADGLMIISGSVHYDMGIEAYERLKLLKERSTLVNVLGRYS